MAPKIYYMHPLVAGRLHDWPASFARIAAMGFDHVCVAPPFQPGDDGDLFAVADDQRLHPALGWRDNADSGLAWAASEAAQSGLRLLLDTTLDRVAVGAKLRGQQPDWFTTVDTGAPPDPRRPPHRLDLAYARLDQAEPATGLITWWAERLGALLRAGIAGFRFLDPDHVPPSLWRQLLRELRDAEPSGCFIAWTPGLDRAALARLAGLGFDRTAASTPWWNSRSPWLVEEIGALRAVAPALGVAEPSFTERLAAIMPPGRDLIAAHRYMLRVAAATGDGLFVPMGFEYATRRPFDAARAGPADMERARADSLADLSDDITEANALVDRVGSLNIHGATRALTAISDPVTAWLRTDHADPDWSSRAVLIAMNPDPVHAAALPFSLCPLPASAGAPFGKPGAIAARADPAEALAPNEVRVIAYQRLSPVTESNAQVLVERNAMTRTRIAIEAIAPSVPGGDFAVKDVAGRAVTVSADIIADGHEVLAADLLWRPADSARWQRVPMKKGDNDRWSAVFTPARIGLYHYTVEAWWDRWGTFHHDLHAKRAAGQALKLEIQEGVLLLRDAAHRAGPDARAVLDDALIRLDGLTEDERAELLLSDDVAAAMHAADDHPFAVFHEPALRLRADRARAEFASWYELFPRSVTDDPSRHGTLIDVISRLPAIAAMGFDVLYFPPIHPIGRVNRKGRNNSLRAEPGDVGSPYAIGGEEGGHDALHPQLGTLEDFRRLVDAAHAHGLELAMDFAVQCAPDHPWLREHPDWFRWRPDGSMRYAENPPKKYEDIVNPDFYADASMPALWHALRDVFLFWVDQGVRIFRVDNPHTKPLPFWQWVIQDVQGRHPDVLFLSEAFTRPKLMYRLAKLGFTQSYTYFTWRNTKQEITEYLTELAAAPVSDFFRPNFFVNTPDINPVFLQTSGRPGFLIRAALATTLSGLWGMYSGFEICESAPLPGREEYLNSEKYEIRPRDYEAPGNIVAEITRLNQIRRAHPALQTHIGVRFHQAWNDQIIVYSKHVMDSREIVVVAVSFDPHAAQEAVIELPLWLLDLPDHGAVSVADLMREHDFVWFGKHQRIRLDPAELPFAIWRLSPIGVA